MFKKLLRLFDNLIHRISCGTNGRHPYGDQTINIDGSYSGLTPLPEFQAQKWSNYIKCSNQSCTSYTQGAGSANAALCIQTATLQQSISHERESQSNTKYKCTTYYMWLTNISGMIGCFHVQKEDLVDKVTSSFMTSRMCIEHCRVKRNGTIALLKVGWLVNKMLVNDI